MRLVVTAAIDSPSFVISGFAAFFILHFFSLHFSLAVAPPAYARKRAPSFLPRRTELPTRVMIRNDIAQTPRAVAR